MKLMNEEADLIRCHCQSDKVPTVAELATEMEESLPYTEEPIATEIRELLKKLPHLTDADILLIAEQDPYGDE